MLGGSADTRLGLDGERVAPGGSAGAGASARGPLDGGELAPPGAVEPAAIWREMVANRRSESNRVTGTVGSRPGVGSWASGVEMRRGRAGTAAAGRLEGRSWWA